MKLLYPVLAALILVLCASGVSGETIVWAVGGNAILRLEEGVWQPVTGVPTCPSCTPNYRRIWGSSSDDVYVVDSANGQLLHHDGTSWQQVILPFEHTLVLYDVFGTGWNDVYVLAKWLDPGWGGGGDAALYHFDGSAWSYEIFSECPAQDACLLPGGWFQTLGLCYNPYTELNNSILRYRDGSGGWHVEKDFEYFTDHTPYYRFSHLSGTNRIALTGRHEDGYYFIAAKNFDFSEYWDVIEESYTTQWIDTWWASENELWSCGTGGAVLRWTPSGIPGDTVFATPTTAALYGIWGASSADVYAVGTGGAIVHYDGAAWSIMESGTTKGLNHVIGTPAAPIATLLQSFSVEPRASEVVVRWSLSECDEGTAFRVTRLDAAGAALPAVDGRPLLERDGLSFEYVDRGVEPGATYAYRVEYSSGGDWRFLFETEAVAIPGAPFALRPGYPNPFNPSTTIEFTLAGSGPATLRVFDVSGKLVRNLLNADVPAGHHSVRWDGLDDRGRPVASGTYFGRLEAGKASASIKLLLVR